MLIAAFGTPEQNFQAGKFNYIYANLVKEMYFSTSYVIMYNSF